MALMLRQTRTFTAAPPRIKKESTPAPTKKRKPSVREQETDQTSRPQKRQNRQPPPLESEVVDIEDSDEDSAPRRSTRARNMLPPSYQEEDDVIDVDEEPAEAQDQTGALASPAALLIENEGELLQIEEDNDGDDDYVPVFTEGPSAVKTEQVEDEIVVDSEDEVEAMGDGKGDFIPDEEEEEKPKPLMHLSYRGFNISGQCLCVVVEPWPPLRAPSRAPSLAPIFARSRQQSLAPSGSNTGRAETPLFLPDPDRRSVTPAPRQERVLPPVPLFNQPSADEIDDELVLDEDDLANTGLMAFSQSIRHGDHTGGAGIDDDELDGAVLFGDADEAREL